MVSTYRYQMTSLVIIPLEQQLKFRDIISELIMINGTELIMINGTVCSVI
jgi:hypothetical protein